MSNTMKAVWVTKTGRDLKDIPIPEPQAGEVLIKNVAVASNPKDWKLSFYIDGHEQVEGNDVAGHVESVGEGVTTFKKGDKVAAFTQMRVPRGGAYAEYSVSPENTVFHLGPISSFEDAAALPLAYMTAVVGLFSELGLPTPDAPAKESFPILIYGASTTVGVYATQLAKKSNLHVVGIAGAASEHAKSYGVDEMIDYRGKSTDELAAAIKASGGGGKVRHVFDAVSEHGSARAIALGLQPAGGRATHVLPLEEFDSRPDNATFTRTMVADAHSTDKPSDKGRELARHWFAKVGEWLEEGSFKPQKVKVIPGGLAGVADGLKLLQDGKVSGEKLVYIIKDTPGLS